MDTKSKALDIAKNKTPGRYEIYRTHSQHDSVYDNKNTPVISSGNYREALAKARKYLHKKGGKRTAVVADATKNDGEGEVVYKKGKRAVEFGPSRP